MHIGIIGLGRMGMNMALRLARGGHTVTGYDRSEEKIAAARSEGIRAAVSLRELTGALPHPKAVWIMIPSGKPVDDTIAEIREFLGSGDIIVDGGNSFYKDSIRRFDELKRGGINFMDMGVSGGVWGLENGYCLMAGGEKETFTFLEPALQTLAPPEGYLYCGKPGAGHFMKMVHNGIEYGMMEAYGEGFELLKASPYGNSINYAEAAHLWNRGSVIRSWLLELLEDAFRKDGRLESISGYVEDSGEGRWMAEEAIRMGVNLPAITGSLFRRFRSRQTDPFGERVLAALRNEFGGHGTRPKKEK